MLLCDFSIYIKKQFSAHSACSAVRCFGFHRRGHGAIDYFRLTIDYCISPQRAQRSQRKDFVGIKRNKNSAFSESQVRETNGREGKGHGAKGREQNYFRDF